MIRIISLALVICVAAFAASVAVLLAVTLLAYSARSQSIGRPGLPLVPDGLCQLTPLASATKLTSCSGGIPDRANLVVLRVEGSTVRYRDDGVAPTAGVGQPIFTTDRPLVYVGNLSAIQFIAASGSPTLDVSFYRSNPP
jgi:hypothetical protein